MCETSTNVHVDIILKSMHDKFT